MRPTALTLAPSHPGPPADRIAATLDALIEFIEENDELAADGAVREALTLLVSLQQTLRRSVAAVEAGGWWLDELLMWLVGLFRFVAGAGTLPDVDRLSRAVQETRSFPSTHTHTHTHTHMYACMYIYMCVCVHTHKT